MPKQLPPETPMFPGHVKPVHVGVYKRVFEGEEQIFFSYWNGYRWGYLVASPRDAYATRLSHGGYQCVPWCGLTEKV